MKDAERRKAIELRKSGKTYDEIQEKLLVARSTLALWLRSAKLARRQKQKLTKARKEAGLRGARARSRARSLDIETCLAQGTRDVARISKRELWFIGVALYWAEGSKQHEGSLSAGIHFGNSDAKMLAVFLAWLADMQVPLSDIHFELYVHAARQREASAFCAWWEHALGLPARTIRSVYFNKRNPKTKRKNIGDLYHGLVRIKVRRSALLNRKINGWINGIVAGVGSHSVRVSK